MFAGIGFVILLSVLCFGGVVVLAFLQELKNQMSALSDKIAAVGASLDEAVARVQEDVAALGAKIVELEALVASGGATPADHDALEALKAKLDAIDPVKPDVLPEV